MPSLSFPEWPLERDEIELDGVRYPVLGPVTRIPVSPFAAKITIGDHTRDSELVSSSWILQGFTGGHGVLDGRWPQDEGRFWYSTLETRWFRSVGLRPRLRTVDDTAFAGAPVTESPFHAAVRFLDFFIIASGRRLLVYDLDLQRLFFQDFSTDITDLLVWKNRLYVARAGLPLLSTSSLLTWETDQVTGRLLADFGGWLAVIDAQGDLYHFDGSSWSQVITTVPFPVEQAVWLFPFFQADGALTLYLVGPDGLYVFDRGVGAFYRTNVTWPHGARVKRGCLWRSEVYIPLNQSLLKWNGQTVIPFGPDRDQGLPETYPREVVAAAPGYGYLYISLDHSPSSPFAEQRDAFEQGWSGGEPFEPSTLSSDLVPLVDPELFLRSVILSSSGGGWHTILAEKVPWDLLGLVAKGGEEFLFLRSGAKLGVVKLSPDLHNPLVPPTQEVSDSGTLLTPRFDAGWAEVPKVALRLTAFAKVAADDLSITISYRTEQSSLWTRVGTITRPGESRFLLQWRSHPFPVFRWIQFRLDFQSHRSDPLATPILEWLVLHYLRRPRQLYAFQTTIDFSRDWRGKRSKELVSHFLSLAMQERPFLFRWSGEEEAKLVVISRLQWAGVSDLFQGEGVPHDIAGRAAVSFIEVLSDASSPPSPKA